MAKSAKQAAQEPASAPAPATPAETVPISPPAVQGATASPAAPAGALVVVSAIKGQEFAILRVNPQEAALAIAANAGPTGVSAFDLDRLGIPAGGGQFWTVPTLEGERVEKEVTGIIIHHQYARAFWRKPYGSVEGGGGPPDCSGDALVGHGTPVLPEDNIDMSKCVNSNGGGYLCDGCPRSQWKTDPKGGQGQWCKLIHRLFVLLPWSTLPYLLPVPPSSVKESRGYMLRLGGLGRPHYAVATTFSLTKEKNANNLDYSGLKMALAQALSPEQMAAIKVYYEAIKPLLASTKAKADEFSEGGGQPAL